ncbi:hypothetical protein BH11PLA2_BH11PLA2_17680 [soil metagenome]
MSAISDATLQEGLDTVAMYATKFSRRECEHRTSSPIEVVDVTLESGAIVPMLLKDLWWESLAPEAQSAKPRVLSNPKREIEAYRFVSPIDNTGMPSVYASGDGWLLIERVAGLELYQVGELEQWQRAAAWLGRFHRWGYQRAPHETFLRHSGDWYRHWLTRALQFVPRTLTAHARLERLAFNYEIVIRELDLPKSILHGEFYASNVLVTPERVCPVDWEMAAHGPGLTDVAALTAGEWSDFERDAMLLAYCEGSSACSNPGPSRSCSMRCSRRKVPTTTRLWNGSNSRSVLLRPIRWR